MIHKKFLPIIIFSMLAIGVFLGARMNTSFIQSKTFFTSRNTQFNKLSEIISYISNEYVDTIDQKMLVDKSIEKILQQLDPHSAYIPAEELQAVNESLEGNFEGIGIEFFILDDTIMVVSAISGGPSEAVGILSGDRIIKVNDEIVAGVGITNNQVLQKLRGKGGTEVTIQVARRGVNKLLPFKIIRGKIPIYSVDVAYMINDSTGLIRISRFSATTYDEFKQALARLQGQGMNQLILDLRGNPGGYLDAAIRIADEFLPAKKLIVYTEGKSRPRTSYTATRNGDFETGKLAILIDEGSASASEIVAGAVQDWDRAVIIGRRTFGKGLVQEQTVFPDGSALRLTIARYYTPTGRSIQKPYSGGYEDYQREIQNRITHGELETADSIHFADTLKYITPGGKTVYGGGGIMPDYFIPLDTSSYSDYLQQIVSLSIISQFAYDYVDKNRKQLEKFKSVGQFMTDFHNNEQLLRDLVMFAESKGVKRNEKGLKKSSDYIYTQLKANIGRLLFRNEGFYPVLFEKDPAVLKALQVFAGEEK
jgi:carboxyl-terminal processing protease